jgi:hypothetical protein
VHRIDDIPDIWMFHHTGQCDHPRRRPRRINSGWRIWVVRFGGSCGAAPDAAASRRGPPNGQPASEPGRTFGRPRLGEQQLNCHRALLGHSAQYRAAGIALSCSGRAGKIAA